MNDHWVTRTGLIFKATICHSYDSFSLNFQALEMGEDGDANFNQTRLRQRKKVIERQESKAINVTADDDIVKNLQVG